MHHSPERMLCWCGCYRCEQEETIKLFIEYRRGTLASFNLLLGSSFAVATRNAVSENVSAYECGFDPVDDARSRLDVQVPLVYILECGGAASDHAGHSGIGAVKRALPDTVSYGQIKVVAALRHTGAAWFQGDGRDAPPEPPPQQQPHQPPAQKQVLWRPRVASAHVGFTAGSQEQCFQRVVHQLAAPR